MGWRNPLCRQHTVRAYCTTPLWEWIALVPFRMATDWYYAEVRAKLAK
jgi:hypothetical protein